MFRKFLLFVSAMFIAATASVAQEGIGRGDEKKQYINDRVQIFEVEAKYINSFMDGKVPGVRYSIKNNGDRVLNKVTVVVYFLDRNGEPFHEEEYNPIWVTSSEFNDDKPLKPNYTYRKDKDTWSVVKNLGDEWGGKIRIEVTNIEFGD